MVERFFEGVFICFEGEARFVLFFYFSLSRLVFEFGYLSYTVMDIEDFVWLGQFAQYIGEMFFRILFSSKVFQLIFWVIFFLFSSIFRFSLVQEALQFIVIEFFRGMMVFGGVIDIWVFVNFGFKMFCWVLGFQFRIRGNFSFVVWEIEKKIMS